jgi:surface polysaccharide O-acyltransferase-like enzyme
MSNQTIVEKNDKQRESYYDFLRGIAIMMVIGIHTYTDGFMHFNLFLRQFLNCAVPIF